MKIGIIVMVLGVFVLFSGVYIVMSAPWEYMDFGGGDSYYEPNALIDELFRPISRTLGWLFATFLVLVANLFLSGIALIITGYTLYHVPDTLVSPHIPSIFPKPITSGSKICPKCGTQNRSTTNYCKNCGEYLA